ncbi:porin, partial [Rhodosalinus sp.]|uniref:porin n=1 Tax=Rhodosalinus sp. TaxID=2047741 RepID=UPI00397B15D5
VSFSGLARFGILYVEDGDTVAPSVTPATAGPDGIWGTADDEPAVLNDASSGPETRIESRFQLDIQGTATADNGLEFTAALRGRSEDNPDGGADPMAWNAAQFGIAYEGLSVQVGNIAGVFDSQDGMYDQSLGLSGLGFHNHVGNSAVNGSWGFDTYSSKGAGRNGVRVAYGMGDFSAIASYSDLDDLERTALGASYSFNDWSVHLGWQDSSDDTEDKISLIVQGDLGPASVTFKAADNDGEQKYVIGGDFDAGAATTISAFFATDEEVGGVGGDTYGVGFVHDLGGGTSIRGGVVDQWNDKLTADLGLQFNF